MKRLATFMLALLLLLPLIPAASAAEVKVGWVLDATQTPKWWYYGKNNEDTVVSHEIEDLVKSKTCPVAMNIGETNRYGGNAVSFDWSLDPKHNADTFCNVGQVVTVDLDTYTHLYFSISDMPAGGSVEVKLSETFAGATVKTVTKAGEYSVDLRTVYPSGGVKQFWVNFCLVLPNRNNDSFAFDYVLIGNENALEFDANAVERTMEPWVLDLDAQMNDWMYYGKNDAGVVLRSPIHVDNDTIPLEFDSWDADDYPGSSMSATFKWPNGSQADFFQRIGIKVTADLDDTPYLYFGADFGRGDWLSVGTGSDFQSNDGASMGDDKAVTGDHVINLKSVYGGGKHTFMLILVFADMNYDGSEFAIDYLYFGSAKETPDTFVPREDEPEPEPEPKPEPKPEPEPEPEPELEPELEPEPNPEPEQPAEEQSGASIYTVIAIVLAALCAVAAAAGVLLLKKDKTIAIVVLAVAAVMLIGAVVLFLTGSESSVPDSSVEQPDDTTPPVEQPDDGEEEYPYEDLVLTPTEDKGSRLHITAMNVKVDPIRADADKDRRMLYIKIENYLGLDIPEATLTYEENGKSVKRTICPIDKDERVVTDTLFIDAAFVGLLDAKVTDGEGKTLWSGSIAVKPARKSFTIAMSHCYELDEIENGMLRGANYFNRRYCWGKDWQQDDFTAQWEADFADFTSKLNVNTVRAFTIFADKDMYHKGNTPTAEILSKVNDFLGIADRHHVRVLFCLNSGFHPGFSEKTGENMRFLRTIVELFQNDGRVLAWDLANEIDCADALAAEIANGEMGKYSRYVTEMYPLLRDVWAPNHITMIGTGFKLYNIEALGVETECGSIHGYIQTDLPVSRVFESYTDMSADFFGGKKNPWMLQEFGFPSEDAQGVEDADYQTDVYRSYIGAIRQLYADDYRLLGTYQWCIYDYVDEANVVVRERRNGVIREDGTVKDAGALLAEFYEELAKSTPAPWDQ